MRGGRNVLTCPPLSVVAVGCTNTSLALDIWTLEHASMLLLSAFGLLIQEGGPHELFEVRKWATVLPTPVADIGSSETTPTIILT